MAQDTNQALTHSPALAPVPFRLASSLQTARVGEVMAIDEQGQVVGPESARMSMLKYWLLMAGLGAAGWSVVVLAGAPMVLGGAVFASSLGLFAWEARRSPAIKRAVALAAAGRRDEAWEAFGELDEARHPAPTQATIDYWMGNLAWQRGELDTALERYTRAIDRCRRSRHMRVTQWIVEFAEAQLLAVRGELDKARLLRANLSDAPRGDYLEMASMLTDLCIAFHSERPDDLPDDDELYEWAKRVLSMSRFGHGAMLLAWAFEQRGDRDMAVMMLTEAPERLRGSFPEQTDPALFSWARAQVAAWDLDVTGW